MPEPFAAGRRLRGWCGAGLRKLRVSVTRIKTKSYVSGNSTISVVFISLLKNLKSMYRRAKTITLIVDNYIIHTSRETQRWLKENPKFMVMYQPVYSPWVNPVERRWPALHDTITRNHQCRTMWQLLKKFRHFIETAIPFPGRRHGMAKVYRYMEQLFMLKVN